MLQLVQPPSCHICYTVLFYLKLCCSVYLFCNLFLYFCLFFWVFLLATWMCVRIWMCGDCEFVMNVFWMSCECESMVNVNMWWIRMCGKFAVYEHVCVNVTLCWMYNDVNMWCMWTCGEYEAVVFLNALWIWMCVELACVVGCECVVKVNVWWMWMCSNYRCVCVNANV